MNLENNSSVLQYKKSQTIASNCKSSKYISRNFGWREDTFFCYRGTICKLSEDRCYHNIFGFQITALSQAQNMHKRGLLDIESD